ncbi:hypothetical protein HPB52_018677 [Rhipicephalus sanguineus]|uniref:C2H2-type domain-containing protein n=1 Tax=Rhipicephalus sanguineus TaxID=34632 RepID=A0A9D4SSQ2_RHISA|nr:hypothetical protein HPB52_018677 [Rhipicephalus sanguineus]
MSSEALEAVGAVTFKSILFHGGDSHIDPPNPPLCCAVLKMSSHYEEEDDDECLTCNVCERSFPSARRLSRHQQRKRHFGCPVCDAIFLPHSPSRTTGEPWSTGRRTMTMKTHRSRIRGD